MNVDVEPEKLLFSEYKSFKTNEIYEINLNKNVTLIIGKNNTGKSSLIDVLEMIYDKEYYANKENVAKGLSLSFRLNLIHIERGFSKSVGGGSIGGNHFEFGSMFENRLINCAVRDKELCISNYQEEDLQWYKAPNEWNNVARSYFLPSIYTCFRRINAERDIVPELENDSEEISFAGDGVSNLIRKYINNNKYDESLVEELLLQELNRIMEPDVSFSNIRIQEVNKNDNNEYYWEIFLQEGSNRFALSKSGSGLKTILLILVNLFLVPKLSKDKKMIYAFEEVENNLHPALQRRVFEYLYDYAEKHDTKIFLTTHSHVAINTFFGRENAQIYHIVKNDGQSDIREIENSIEKYEILNDLDVKASDIFQSNGIIWVEGPSDRIYLLKWLEVFCDSKFIEGQDFQFMYYGGRLLSHYSADVDNDTEGLINVLIANRNAAIMIDSDKTVSRGRLNETKRRIRDEFKRLGYFCWITKGKEIENYISVDAINTKFDQQMEQISDYDLFPEYIKKVDNYFSNHKVEFARRVCPYITTENSENIMDLKEQVVKLYNEICKWNNIKPDSH